MAYSISFFEKLIFPSLLNRKDRDLKVQKEAQIEKIITTIIPLKRKYYSLFKWWLIIIFFINCIFISIIITSILYEYSKAIDLFLGNAYNID